MRAITWICRLGVIALAAALLFGAVIVAIAPRVWGVANSWDGQPLALPAWQPLARPTQVYDAGGNLIATFQRQNSQPVELAADPRAGASRLPGGRGPRVLHPQWGQRPQPRPGLVLSNVASDNRSRAPRTITMQVAKNEFLGGIERDFRYKALQIHYAMMLENQYSKDAIFERYLNTVFFGNNAYGVQAAAEVYFGKTVDQLTFVEGRVPRRAGAFAFGLRPDSTIPAQPGALRPGGRPPRRVGRVAGVGGAGNARDVRGAGAHRNRAVRPARSARTYFTEALRDYLLNRTSLLGGSSSSAKAGLYRGGLRSTRRSIRTSRRIAEQARNQLPENPAGLRRSGRVARHELRGDRAMVGGHGFQPGENEVNMAFVPRQTGSSIKLFILAAALRRGHADDVIDGPPCTFPIPATHRSRS